MVGNIPTRVDDGSWLLSVVTLGPILHLTVGSNEIFSRFECGPYKRYFKHYQGFNGDPGDPGL